MNTKFDDSTEIAVMVGTLKNIDKFVPLIISTTVMKEGDHLWWQASTWFIKEVKGLRKNLIEENCIKEWIMGI